MNMLKLVPIALISIGLTACGGESSSDIKVPTPKLDPALAKSLQETANQPKALNKEDFEIYSDSSMETKSSYADYEFSVNRDLPFMYTTEKVGPGTVQYQMDYSWSRILRDEEHDGKINIDEQRHLTRVQFDSLDDATMQLRRALQSMKQDPESKIRRYVLSNMILPITINHNSNLNTFEDLFTQPTVGKGDEPLCEFKDGGTLYDQGRTDYSMICNLSNLNEFGKEVQIEMNQISGQEAVIKTTDNESSYEVYLFEQVVTIDPNGQSKELVVANVFYRPGLGILGIEPAGQLGNFTTKGKEFAWGTRDANLEL